MSRKDYFGVSELAELRFTVLHSGARLSVSYAGMHEVDGVARQPSSTAGICDAFALNKIDSHVAIWIPNAVKPAVRNCRPRSGKTPFVLVHLD